MQNMDLRQKSKQSHGGKSGLNRMEVELMARIIEIEIGCCGECPYYSMKKHKCQRGATDEREARDHFYRDCPLSWREPPENVDTDGGDTDV